MLSDPSLEIEILSDPSQIHVVEEKLEGFFHKEGLDQDTIENLGIATTEMVNNAIRHGNKGDEKQTVMVRFEKQPTFVKVTVYDKGKGFDPESLANPLDPENLFKDSGRGIFIVKSLMDDVQFEFTDEGTRVIMIKKL